MPMPQIKLACRLAFWNLRKNHKKFQLKNSIFPSRNAEAAFTRALMGLRVLYLKIWWMLYPDAQFYTF